jgi:very-short-patch-repair endonuclease
MTKDNSGANRQAILRLLEDARNKLVETGTRNRLVHINRKNSRANALNIVDEKSDAVFDFLHDKGKKMRFYAQGKDEESTDTDSPKLIPYEEKVEFDEARYYDNMLETKLSPDKLQKRLLKLNKDAAVAEQEQGINILYLALGFLTWYEDKSSAVKREAPLILLPVELVRNQRTATYEIICRDDDLVTNLPLQQRMLNDFGIELPELDIVDDWTPSTYFNQLEMQIANKENWSIDKDGMQLGFFSFAKLLMLRDLDPENWSAQGLENNPLIQGLLKSGVFEEERPLFSEDVNLDTILNPIDIIQVVDADASQTKVIEEVRSGRNLVVEGPPGTGKSQTITNIIAAAAYDGKKVLFMAEKMAALNVVHDKLLKTGLEDICLELHSRSANKKAVLKELESTLHSAHHIPTKPEQPFELTKLRDQLNKITNSIHSPFENTEETPYQVMGTQAKLVGLGVPVPKVSAGKAASVPKEEFEEVVTSVRSYAMDLSDFGSLREHPLYGVNNIDLQPIDRQRVEQKLPSLIKGLEHLEILANKLFFNLSDVLDKTISNSERVISLAEVSDSLPDTDSDVLKEMLSSGVTDRMLEGLRSGAKLKLKKETEAKRFIEAAWDFNVSQVQIAVSAGEKSFWTRLGSKYRSASKDLSSLISIPLPKSPTDRLRLINKLIGVQKLARDLHDDEAYLVKIFGVEWRGEKTPFESLLKSAEWVNKVSSITSDFDAEQVLEFVNLAKGKDVDSFTSLLSDMKEELKKNFSTLDLALEDVFDQKNQNDVPFKKMQIALDKILANVDKYAEWTKTRRLQKVFDDYELTALKDQVESGQMTAEMSENELRFSRAETVWNSIRDRNPLPQAAFERTSIVEAYQAEGKERVMSTRQQIKFQHLSQVPKGAAGQMGVIRSEIAKKKRHYPIRQLMIRASEAIQRIKPVFLMSPVSVSQFLPPEQVEFDLLVIDEASQVRPEDALGAIARSKQIVVVGDRKQMPPSAFFDRMTSNESVDGGDDDTEGAAKATELESILTLCEARGLGGHPRMLEWHYRSKDPSLIRVSNDEFYDGKLILPPSPLQDDDSYGLSLVRVNGVYRRGAKNNINSIEADALVDSVCKHAREDSNFSLGIATFSVVQRNHINELLEYRRRSDSVLDAFLREGKEEDIFVKNLENVQGDERDVIFISVGYGPTEPNGSLTSMSFGPVNSDGGERRLNVLFTRARIRCKVFCSFDPAEIDLSRSKVAGTRILKRFLEYAKNGFLVDHKVTGLGPDSPFEEDVAQEIRKLGYNVEYQVGSQGFRIDLGVKHLKHDSQFVCAVECDGATYHSALWARERDRLRQEVLENHGWRFHRIWSTDWFNNRQFEIERLGLALAEAMDAADGGIEVKGSNESGDSIEIDEISESLEESSYSFEPGFPVREIPLYRKFDLSVKILHIEPHEAARSSLISLVTQIVGEEGPIHSLEVARRLAESFGKKKTGARIKSLAITALRGCTNIEHKNGFYFTPWQRENVSVRDRSSESGSLLKGDMIPPMEVLMAKKYCEEDNGYLEKEALVKAIATMFGFKRVGPDLNEALLACLEEE